MKASMRIMSENPLNAETPVASLQSWITSNKAFFKRDLIPGDAGNIPGRLRNSENTRL